MKLSKLYCNFENVFEPIFFRSGLNVVLAEIRLPQVKDKDSHNLGKSTLGKLINFCMLSTQDSNFFLFKHIDVFEKYVFFLELELQENKYLTIRRSVEHATKICFKMHNEKHQDFRLLPVEDGWDHSETAFEKSKAILDGILDFREISPWSYRKILGYLLRTQSDYIDVFRLAKFSGKHIDWKPFLAHILGLDYEPIENHYRHEEELADAKTKQANIKSELGAISFNPQKIDGIISIKVNDLEKKEKFIDDFDFREIDKEAAKVTISKIDKTIAEFNESRYLFQKNRERISEALKEDTIEFDTEQAKALFGQMGVFFDGQIKKDFDQLLSFNKSITEERAKYLQGELDEINVEISSLNSKINSLNKKRIKNLSFLKEADVFEKYKRCSEDIVILKTDIAILNRQKQQILNLKLLQTDIQNISDKIALEAKKITENLKLVNEDKDGKFDRIRIYFSEIIDNVIGCKALLSVVQNNQDHIDFSAEILDEKGNTTSADDGNSYKRLMCIAFDLSILKCYLGKRYPHFVYHDGIFESLDDRKKFKLMEVIRGLNQDGLQHIITLIDSDLPTISVMNEESEEVIPFIRKAEIIKTLHDEGQDGRLFKIKSW